MEQSASQLGRYLESQRGLQEYLQGGSPGFQGLGGTSRMLAADRARRDFLNSLIGVGGQPGGAEILTRLITALERNAEAMGNPLIGHFDEDLNQFTLSRIVKEKE